MNSKKVIGVIIAASLTLSALNAYPAAAEDASTADEALHSAGETVTSDNAALDTGEDGYVTEQNGIAIALLSTSDGEIVLDSEEAKEPEITIDLPGDEQANEGELSELGGVTFKNTEDSSSTVLAKQDGSVQIAVVIESADAPHDYDFTISGSEESQLKLEDDGSVSLVDAHGDWEAGVAPPWAKDANGGALPTSYTVDGNVLTQHVGFSADTAFPVVADPWLGKALIQKTRWAHLSKRSPSLQVYPTKWGRFGPIGARWAAWSETLKKTSRRGHPNPNTSSMKNQFYCHYDIVRIVRPFKASWNLDTKLPNRGYTGFVRKGCN